MDLHCPYCDFVMSVKGVRPGRFTPRCSNCKEKFALAIPDGEGAVPRVKKLPPAAVDATSAPMANAIPSANATERMPSPATAGPRVAAPRPAAPPEPKPHPPADTRPPSSSMETALPHAPSPTAPPASSPSAAAQAAPPTPPPMSPLDRPSIQADADDADAPAALGGYQVVRKLGQGGMGAVYLARQMSLDRLVAVKVLSPQLSQDAGFVARFTREAYAAAQLVHHNVVQVYDIGEDNGRHFYSMEFVEGETLAGLVHKNGKLDPESSVAYTLQAARGLKFAHDRGLVHRDVKPDNLMLSDQGIVKVADLGLVKKHGVTDVKRTDPSPTGKLDRAQSAETTGFNLSMGTPAYMAPEQARDAAHVDHRADIYSLGCTLYDLLVGRPPFSGKTAIEVMTKHASEPITPPDVLSKRVPKEVSQLLMKMVAKRPEDRYPTMAACIAAMEDFLGTSSSGPFTPKEEHAAAMEAAAKTFHDAPLAMAARYAVPAFFGLVAVLAVFAALFGDTLASRVVWVGTYAGLAVLTTIAYVVVAGVTRRDVVLGRLRPLVFGARIGDWVRGLLLAGVAVLLLYVFGLAWAWSAVALISVGIAAAYHFGLQWPRDRQRQTAVASTEEMLRTMRLRGLEEETLRQFVCRYSGKHWEAFYEALFGYDAKLDARRRWGLSLRGKPRPKAGVWRDAIIGWASTRVNARKVAREKRLLARAEEAKLKADGVDLLTARKAAAKEAAALVRRAEAQQQQLAARDVAVREAEARAAVTAGPSAGMTMPVAAPVYVPPAYVSDEPVSEESVERDHDSAFARRGGLTALLFGTGVRFPIALALLAVFFLWFHQTNPQFPNNFGQTLTTAVSGVQSDLEAGRDVVMKGTTVKTSSVKPAQVGSDLKVPMVPQFVRHQLSGYGIGLAGLLLLMSCAVSGWMLGFAALLGAAVIVLGDLVVPGVGGLRPASVAMAAGTAIGVLGFVFGRER